MKRFTKLAAAAAIASLTSAGAMAFNNGVLGNNTSTGDVQVLVQKDTLVLVDGLTQDHDFGAAA